MKETVVPIDKAGRIVLPKSVRDELAIRPGDLFTVAVEGNKLTLQPNKKTAGFIRKGRALVFSAQSGPQLDHDIVETIRADQHARQTTEITPPMTATEDEP